MGLEQKRFRGMFDAEERVELRQVCFTPSQVFQPGTYIAGNLPDIAFEMGLVEKLPPVRGKSAEIQDADNNDSPA